MTMLQTQVSSREERNIPVVLEKIAGNVRIPADLLASDPHAVMTDALRCAAVFDEEWYKTQYPDVAAAGIDPIDHYVSNGAAEGRNPTPWFNTAFYQEMYPDVLQGGVNPLFHFVFHGYSEGRLARQRNMESELLVKQAVNLESTGQYAEAQALYAQAIAEAEDAEVTQPWYVAQGKCAMSQRFWTDAEEAFRHAIVLKPADAVGFQLLSESLCMQCKWWQEIDALEQAVTLDPSHAAWWYRLGQAREIMERWSQAANAYQEAIQRDWQWAEWFYRLGYVQEMQGLHLQAQKSYAEAITRDQLLDSKKFGIGVFHQQRAYWPEARKAYEDSLRDAPAHAALYCKLAVALHRCYDMEKAAIANVNALTCSTANTLSDKEKAECYYRLGITSERMEKFEQAAEAYACARSITDNAYWCYRHGYTLAKAGKHEEACSVYGQSRVPKVPQASQLPNVQGDEAHIPDATVTPSRQDMLTLAMARQAVEQYRALLAEDTTRPEWHFALGHYEELTGNVEEACAAFAAAAARQSEHFPEGWFRLGKALTSVGRYQQACEAFAHMEILRRPYWVSKTHYNANSYFKRSADYLEYCEHLPVSENIVLYESLLGNAPGDNPYALFQYMLHEKYKQWLHVWGVEDLKTVPKKLKIYSNVIFVQRESNAYLRYLATAKICINDCTFPQYFIRRDEQKYLNTWHGTPMKTLGKDIVSEPLGYGNAQRNFLHCTHLIHQNEHTKNIITKSYHIDTIYTGANVVTGYPRNDVIINSCKSDKITLRKQLGISDNKKVILYAPTWRGAFDGNNIETSLDFINDVLSECENFKDYTVLFRAHHALERRWTDTPQCKIVPRSIVTNELLSIVDVLITDYSSIYFDFLITGKPVIFYTHDLEEYKQERGLYLMPNELPGAACNSIEELHGALADINTFETPNSYKKARKTFCSLDDGKVCERVVNLLDAPLPRLHKSKKKRLLFYVDLMPNGIGTSFLSLIHAIDKKKYDIYIMLNKSFMLKTSGALTMLADVDVECKIISADRILTMNIEEQSVYKNYENRKLVNTFLEIKCIECFYQREYKRLFSKVKFDVIIDFCGYSALQSELFAFSNNSTKVIFLHNDMQSEYETRFTVLKRIFKIYNKYSYLASVCNSINVVNKNILNANYGVSTDKFVPVPNMQRPSYVIQASKDKIDPQYEMHFADTNRVFITLGRLSPEKNHALLIAAFAALSNKYTNLKLLILGKGPLEETLQIMIAEYGLLNNIHLLGHIENPYPYLHKADCFVFPSKYEGQGIVLYEAMALNRPIVSTNIPTSVEVLKNGKYGLLVDQTIESLAKGMEDFLLDKISAPQFDFEKYNKNAMHTFEALLK